MRTPRITRHSRKTYLTALAIVSVVALLLPENFTGGLLNFAQLLVPFQHATTVAVDSMGVSLGAQDSSVCDGEHAELQRQKEAMEHQVAALSLRVSDLEQEVEILTATRLWDVGESRVGSQGRLIPARIVAGDLLSWRSSRLINAGSLQGTKHGAPVVSEFFSIDRGRDTGLTGGMAILMREALIGVVEQVATHTARVQLLSDVNVGLKVRIGRLTGEGFSAVERYFWLVGCGGGKMEIRDANRRDVESGAIKVDDVVLSDPTNDSLPAAMTIGKITAIRLDHNNPLLSILTVESVVDTNSLRRVYVYDSGTLPGG